MTSKTFKEAIIKTRNEIINNLIVILSTRPGWEIIFKRNGVSIKNCSGGVCEIKSIHLRDIPPILNTGGICQTPPNIGKLIIKTQLNKDFSENDFDIEELLKLLEFVSFEVDKYEEQMQKNSKRYWKLTDLASWIEIHVLNGEHFGDLNDKKYWIEIISNWKHGFVDFYEAIQESIDRGYLRLRDKLVFLDEMASEFFGFETSEELYDYFEEEIKDAETDIAAKQKSNSI